MDGGNQAPESSRVNSQCWGLKNNEVVEQGWRATPLVLNVYILDSRLPTRSSVGRKQKGEGRKANFPKHTFYYCTKSTSTPLLFSPT